MIKFLFKNKILLSVFFGVISVFLFGKISSAQTGECQIDPVGTTFRVPGGAAIINDYTDNPRPKVYLDVKTINCNTLSTTNFLNFVFYSVDWDFPDMTEISVAKTDFYVYTAPSSVTTIPSTFSAVTNLKLTNSSDFSIPIDLGERGVLGECASNAYVNDCLIYMKVFLKNPATPGQPDTLIHEMGGIQDLRLLYECDGSCNSAFLFSNTSTCFLPSDPGSTGNGILPYGQTCTLDTSMVNVTTSNGSQSGSQDGNVTPIDFSEAPLAPLPGFDTNPDLGGFLKSLFTFLIVIAGLLAFIMIVRGGITYLTSDSFGEKGNGKQYIMNAIVGLVLALGAWVILNTINPDLASDLNIAIPQVSLDGYEYASPGVASIPSSGCGPKNGIVCTDCQPIEGGISLKPEVASPPHNTIRSDMRQKLYSLQNNLNSNGISWRVTEAFRPTYEQHCSQCHYNGTCIDANFTSTPPTPQNIQAFVNAAAQAGLRAVYETNNSETISQIQQQTDLQPSTKGGQGNYLLLNGITAPHFSVYNQ